MATKPSAIFAPDAGDSVAVLLPVLHDYARARSHQKATVGNADAIGSAARG